MNPVEESQPVAPGLEFWQGHEEEVRCDCGSCAVLKPGGWVVFDPVPLADSAWKRLLDTAPVRAIALTGANHQRHSIALREKFHIKIHAPAAARENLEADEWLDEGDDLCGLCLVGLPGAGPGESAYCDGRVLVIGDALIHPGDVEILPDKYCDDPRLLRASLRKLVSLTYEFAFFAHGLPAPAARMRKELLQILRQMGM